MARMYPSVAYTTAAAAAAAIAYLAYRRLRRPPPDLPIVNVRKYLAGEAGALERLSALAATLASGGVNPLSGERVLEPRTVRNCLSLMQTAGTDTSPGQHERPRTFTINSSGP